MSMSLTTPSPEVQAAREDLLAAMKPHADKLTGQEILGLLAYMVGTAIAAQDQRTMTPEMAIELVQINIEQGNLDALAGLLDSKGQA